MDPIAIIGSCITLARAIYALKQQIKSDDEACQKFFNRIEGLQGPLDELRRMKLEVLNTRSASINQTNEALKNIDDVLTKRVKKRKSIFSKIIKAMDSQDGSFSCALAELNVDLDRCVAALQLAVCIDTGAAIRDDTQAIRVQNAKMSDQMSDSSRMVSAVHDDTQAMLEQLDRIAAALQHQVQDNFIETQFVKDPNQSMRMMIAQCWVKDPLE